MKSTRQGNNDSEVLYVKYRVCKAKRQRVQWGPAEGAIAPSAPAWHTGLETIHLFPAKYRQSARISVIVHRIRQYGIEHLLLGTEHEVRYSAA